MQQRKDSWVHNTAKLRTELINYLGRSLCWLKNLVVVLAAGLMQNWIAPHKLQNYSPCLCKYQVSAEEE